MPRTTQNKSITRYSVFSVGFGAGCKNAGPEYPMRHQGVFNKSELGDLLHRVENIEDAVGNSFVPQLMIQGPNAHHHVQLHPKGLRYSREAEQKFSPVSVDGILEELGAIVLPPMAQSRQTAHTRGTSKRPKLLYAAVAAGITLLIQGGVFFSGYYSLVRPAPADPITEPSYRALLTERHTGLFRDPTGKSPVGLMVSPHGTARLYEIRPHESGSENADLISSHSYSFARVRRMPAVVLNNDEIIPISRTGELVYRGIPLVKTGDSIPLACLQATPPHPNIEQIP